MASDGTGTGIILVFAGEYDVGCKAEFAHELEAVATEDELILDFREVTYLDSSCLTDLIRLQSTRRDMELEPFTIVADADSCLTRMFQTTELTSLFRISDSLSAEAARAARNSIRRAFSTLSERTEVFRSS
jgi:anti-anti-sigma factor